MNVIEDFICANQVLHEQFCVVTRVLCLFVREQVRGLSLTRLQHETKRPAAELRQICIDLARLQLLRRQLGRGERWVLAREPALITLEDAFDCLMSLQSDLLDREHRKVVPRSVLRKVNVRRQNLLDDGDRSQIGIEIAIMQAAMSINQTTRQHLRQFHLCRLPFSVALQAQDF